MMLHLYLSLFFSSQMLVQSDEIICKIEWHSIRIAALRSKKVMQISTCKYFFHSCVEKKTRMHM